MSPPLKECTTEIDYAAFMLAMVFARHEVSHENLNQQWTAEVLMENNNKMEYSKSPNFSIDVVALKQGMTKFSTEFKKRGIENITIYKTESSTPVFFSLPANKRGIDIKFSACYTPPKYSEVELLNELKRIRNMILTRCQCKASIHHSPAAVFGCLYYSIICGLNKKKVDNNVTIKSSIKNYKSISKSPARRSVRAIRSTVSTIIKNVEDRVGNKNAIFYLCSAVKKKSWRMITANHPNQKIPLRHNQNQHKQTRIKKLKTNGEIVTIECNAVGAVSIADDARIKSALIKIPKKYTRYTNEDKTNVLELYSAVRNVIFIA